MSEEIMIAEECCYYNKDNYPYCCEIWDNECEAQNCYYKQLKKAKKENKKLKEALENVRSYLKLTGVLWDNELLLDTNTQRAVDVINEVLKDDQTV